MNNNLAKNTILLSIGVILSKGMQFIMIPFYSRWLSSADFGIFDLYCTYISLLLPIINMASGEAIFRYSMDAKSENDTKKYISNGLGIILINYTVFLAVLFVVYIWGGWGNFKPFVCLLLGQLFNEYLQAYLRSTKQLNVYSFVSSFSVILIAVFVTFFVKSLNMGLGGILYGYALGYILSDLILIMYSSFIKHFSLYSISVKEMLKLIKYSYPLIFNNISWWVMNVSDRILVNIFIGATANGIYAVANKIPSVCSSVFSVFSISWQQSAIEMLNTDKRTEYYNNVFNKMIAILCTLCAGILSMNFLLFKYIFDVRYYTAYEYTPILVTAVIFLSLSQFFGGIQISLKQPKENGITTIIGAVCNILINLVFIHFGKLFVASLSTLIANYVIYILRKNKVSKIIDIRVNRKNWINLSIYLYFCISSYFINSPIFNLVNVIFACAFFIIINNSFIKAILSKFKIIKVTA